MSANDIAVALQRVVSGDQSPPRPWAYLAHVGITAVSMVGYLAVGGFTDQAGFEITTDADERYEIMVRRVR